MVKELVKHIEILLLDNDCVVIPQLGGLVTCLVPATYVEEESLFLPPIRTVGFNEQLKEDDGLLVQSYMTAYHTTEAEAQEMLDAQIRELQQELCENGVYDLGSIGVLTVDEKNNISFSPCQAGTVCPSFYGLDALSFEQLPDLSVEHKKDASCHPTVRTMPDANEITIRIKKSWINNVATIAAMVILFFVLSPSARNTGMVSEQQADFARLMTIRPVANETTVLNAVPAKAETVETVKATPETVSEPETVQPAGVASGYCVVVASAISERNAKDYVEALHKRGFKEATVYKKGKMVRVVFPGFSSETEAHAQANKLGESEEFASAWVYLIP